LTQRPPKYILPLIVLSQFAGASLWFVGNAILPELQQQWHLEGNAIGTITSIVQLGFIGGTLVFSLLAIADRFTPSRVFFVCSLLAALSNLGIVWIANDAITLMTFRFLTGFFLAGIYPVGMKIAADWYEQGLGKALGYLLGALVLGTAFPHLLKASAYHLPWREVIYVTSAIALTGGLLIWTLVPEGPYRKKGSSFHPGVIIQVFRSKDFRAASFGYFGHMWELYAFWAFVPVLLQIHQQHQPAGYNIIGTGSAGCIIGGYVSQKAGSARVAFYALLASGLCCCTCWLFVQTGDIIYLLFLLIWGVVVIADSPQFSALVAQTAPAENKGTAITIVVCIGFAITIASIQLLNYLFHRYETIFSFLVLIPGPVFGLLALYPLAKRRGHE
jgi:MFS family permease